MIKRYPLVDVSLRNGVIGGVLSLILFLTLYYLGRHPFMIPVFMDFRILIFSVMIFFTLKEFRDYNHGGVLHFWQGMLMSFIFTLVFALIGLLAVWGFGAWKPEFVSAYISIKLEQARQLPPETIEQIGKAHFDEIVQALPATRGFDLALVYFWTSFVISFFFKHNNICNFKTST